MKILVTGGNGEFCKHLVNAGKGHSFLTPSKKEADVRDYDNLNWYFHNHHKEFDYECLCFGYKNLLRKLI